MKAKGKKEEEAEEKKKTLLPPVGVDVSAQVVTPPSLEDPKTLQMSSTLTCNTVFPTLCQLRIYIAVETRTHKYIKSKRDSTYIFF